MSIFTLTGSNCSVTLFEHMVAGMMNSQPQYVVQPSGTSGADMVKPADINDQYCPAKFPKLFQSKKYSTTNVHS